MKTFFSRLTQLSVVVSAFTSICVSAEAQLTSLKVDSDVVYFTTDEAKSGTRPSCMASENSELWSLSLTTATGKAIYPLLVAASTDRRPIAVSSANDCGDASGVERVAGIELGQKALSVSTSGKGTAVYLFKADGITKVGRVLGSYNASTVTYFTTENSSIVKALPMLALTIQNFDGIYFGSKDCTGTPYTTSQNGVFRDEIASDGALYMPASNSFSRNINSYWRYDDNGGLRCNFYNNTQQKVTHQLIPYHHDVCGSGQCILKEE